MLCLMSVLILETVQSRQGELAFLPCAFNQMKQRLIPNVIQWLRAEEEVPVVMKIWNRPLQVIHTSLKGGNCICFGNDV